jgi:prolyl-tRNA synthetase
MDSRLHGNDKKMLQSKLFTKIERNTPKDEPSLNAQLLTRGGFIYKNSAGIYSFLPLGWRVIKKIEAIVREEMDAIGGQEILMSALHDKHYLQKSGRWDVDVVFKVIAAGDKEPSYNASWTHEEIMAEIASKYVSSYRDLPFAAYQIQTKFRNEPRAKSGILRGREFLMKDLYSFHASEEDLFRYYAEAAKAYTRVFDRLGTHAVYTLASGGEFTLSNTHEFQVILPIGEDTIVVCDKCEYAENEEITKLKEGDPCPKCGGTMRKEKSVEAGNIFPLGTKYAEAFNLQFVNEKGEKQYVVMGSYGIGITRMMGILAEKYHDEKGLIWPDATAPFRVHLLSLGGADGMPVYEKLQKVGIEVLYDDRDLSAGQKFAEADLIGIPWRMVVSPKVGDGKVELKRRNEEKAEVMEIEEAITKTIK